MTWVDCLAAVGIWLGLRKVLPVAAGLAPGPRSRQVVAALAECPFCCGFHAGWMAWLLSVAGPDAATWAFAGGAACYLAAQVDR